METWQGNYMSFSLTREDAESCCSHSGRCDDDVEGALRLPYIAEQFANADPEEIRNELREWGAWDENELRDDIQNRARLLWLVAGNLNDESDEREAKLAAFIKENRAELVAAITRACPNVGELDDDDLEQWIANDEGLYNWARQEGVPV